MPSLKSLKQGNTSFANGKVGNSRKLRFTPAATMRKGNKLAQAVYLQWSYCHTQHEYPNISDVVEYGGKFPAIAG